MLKNKNYDTFVFLKSAVLFHPSSYLLIMWHNECGYFVLLEDDVISRTWDEMHVLNSSIASAWDEKENFIIERAQPDQSSCSRKTKLEAISYQCSMLFDGMHGWVFDAGLWGQSRMGALRVWGWGWALGGLHSAWPQRCSSGLQHGGHSHAHNIHTSLLRINIT